MYVPSTDIEPKPNISGCGDDRADKLLWTRSDDAFRFNFLPDSSPTLQEKTSPSPAGFQPAAGLASLTGPGSDFAFDFQIPPLENMETTDTGDIASASSQHAVREAKPSPPRGANPPPEPSLQSKPKKKKKNKSGKNNPSDSTEAQQAATSAEGGRGGEDAELVSIELFCLSESLHVQVDQRICVFQSAEEQLSRQLDWCIEQLECSMSTQKIAPKQSMVFTPSVIREQNMLCTLFYTARMFIPCFLPAEEEASRALKTLRSSKAPLAKKRQVMRAMTGDYRKKMDEEKSRQYRLIQSGTWIAAVELFD